MVSLKNLFPSDYFYRPIIYYLYRLVARDAHTHTHVHTFTHTKRRIRKRQRSERGKSIVRFSRRRHREILKRGRSIGFDPTRDCACLPLVGRTYVGTYILCIRIYMCIKKKYIYIYYILYILFRICITRTPLRVRREKRSLVVTNRAEDTRGLRFEWGGEKKKRKRKEKRYAVDRDVNARACTVAPGASRGTPRVVSPGKTVRLPRMYTSVSARNRLRERFRLEDRRPEIGPSCESSRAIFFHATVNSRAYTAGCCLLSGAVALKTLGETQEERILRQT